MVSTSEDVGARGEKLLRDPRRDAESGRGVLAIDDAEIDLALCKDVRQPFVNDLAAGRADNVANEKDFQSGTFRDRIVSPDSHRKNEPLDSLRSLGTTMLIAS
jgi:hypothetical protein